MIATSKNDKLTHHLKGEKTSIENNFEIGKLLKKTDSNLVNANRMDKTMEKDIIATFNKTRNELWLNKTKDPPEEEKFEKETLEEKHPLKENNRINYLSKQEKYILILVDTLLSTTAIGPLVIGFWRGTWGLMDFYGDMFPFWLCFTFGIVTHTMFAFVKHLLYEFVNENKIRSTLNRIICQCLRVTYTYVFGLICILHWRGGWIILDEYLHIGELWITASLTTTFLGALIFLRCVRTLLAPPFFVAIDSYRHLFLFPSLCKRGSLRRNTGIDIFCIGSLSPIDFSIDKQKLTSSFLVSSLQTISSTTSRGATNSESK